MTQAYRTRPGSTTGNLSEEHHRMLVEGSVIDPEVIAERGVRTVTAARGQLPNVYSWRQKKRAPGILFTLHRPNGEACTIFRPDKPAGKKGGHKYEQECKKLGGSGNVLDIHPSIAHLLDDVSVPVVFVEGIKKADAITSAARAAGIDLLVVAVSGVWNFLSDGEPVEDFYAIPVEDRQVIIAYDSDILRNPDVQMAAERLAGHLTPRGAEVSVVYFSDQPDGSKCGADDFLAGGGTLAELRALARPFDPEDFQRVKLSKNERLRRALAWLKTRLEEMPAKSRRDCSKLAAWRACLTLAERRGKLAADGIEVVVPSMTGAELAAMSQPTFSACLTDFEADGRIRRIKRERSEHADSYVLLIPERAFLYNHGTQGSAGEQRKGNTSSEREVHRGYKVARASLPELRWSSPGSKARRGVIRETRRVRQGRSLMEDRPSVRRPGKKRAEIVRHLVENGGSAELGELVQKFGSAKTRPRDFVRRQLADLMGAARQHRGRPLTVGPPIIAIEDDAVRLLPDWTEALEQHRAIGEEEEAAIRQKADHLRQRAAYRARSETKADRAPSEEEMAEGRADRHARMKVEKLVYQGMARRMAVREVYDGFVEELQRGGPEPPPRRPRRKKANEVPKANGVYIHGPLCDCEWCSYEPESSYATGVDGWP